VRTIEPIGAHGAPAGWITLIDMSDFNTAQAGRHACEIYTSECGTRLTAIGAKWTEAQLPLETLEKLGF